MEIKLSMVKLISDPILGLIDIGPILSLVDIKAFQATGFKYQLGMGFAIFPAATHTRKQHSFGAYERTRRLTADWIAKGFINAERAKILCVYALYHDIGHGPFSHDIESLCRVDHDKNGLRLVKSLKKEVENAGFDHKALVALFENKDPLYLAVFDKNLGTEKFDYLSRDAFYTIKEAPGVDYLSKYIYYINDQVVIDERVIDSARSLQDFYIKMSKSVYLRKKSSILQKYIQKMTNELMMDGLSEKELWGLTDFGLLGRMELSKNKLVKFYYENLLSGRFPKVAVELKYKEFALNGAVGHKPIKILGLENTDLDKIILSDFMNDLNKTKEVEDRIAKIANIPQNSVLVVPPLSLKRFKPEDIRVYCAGGKINMVSQMYPNHFKSLTEYGQSHNSLKVCTFEEYREKLNKKADEVKDILLSLND